MSFFSIITCKEHKIALTLKLVLKKHGHKLVTVLSVYQYYHSIVIGLSVCQVFRASQYIFNIVFLTTILQPFSFLIELCFAPPASASSTQFCEFLPYRYRWLKMRVSFFGGMLLYVFYWILLWFTPVQFHCTNLKFLLCILFCIRHSLILILGILLTHSCQLHYKKKFVFTF